MAVDLSTGVPHELELEESELFDSVGAVESLADEDYAQASPIAAAAQAAASGSEDDDDGIVLDDDSASGSEPDEADWRLRERMRSLQSSYDRHQSAMQEAGTSMNSQVGSLRAIERSMSSNLSRRPFVSETDLFAASLPAAAAVMAAGRHRSVPPQDRTAYLGTSMPISIPAMMRRKTSLLSGGAGLDPAAAPATFVPPHLLERSVSGEEAMGFASIGGAGQSPTSGAQRRDKLMARNAILRSTGFIEVHKPAVATIGDVMDPVKESALASSLGQASTPSLAIPAAERRTVAASSLTALLGSSR